MMKRGIVIFLGLALLVGLLPISAGADSYADGEQELRQLRTNERKAWMRLFANENNGSGRATLYRLHMDAVKASRAYAKGLASNGHAERSAQMNFIIDNYLAGIRTRPPSPSFHSFAY